MVKKAATGRTPVSTRKPSRAPRSKAARPDCRCGCGTTLSGAKSKFAQGHDAKVYGQVFRGERPESDIADCPGLMSKLEHARKQAAKAPTPKAKASASAPTPTEPATDDGPTKVKIGRKTYLLNEVIEINGSEATVTYVGGQGEEQTVQVPVSALS